MQIYSAILTFISISILSGCATKDSILPMPDQDMQSVYDQHMKGIGDGNLFDKRSVLRRPMIEEDVALSEYVRTEATQLEAKFKMLPNPTMYMFVAPHLASRSNVPIPGYLTEFKMWEGDHYALPGEVSDLDGKFRGQ